MLYLVIFLLLLMLIVLTRLEIIFEYNLLDGKDHVVITISLFWGLIKIRKNMTKVKEKKETELKDNYLHLKLLYKLFDLTKQYLKRKIVIKDLQIAVEVGLEDACYTGIISGMIWSIIGTTISVLTNIFETKKFYFNVLPDFSKKVLKLDLDCIFTIKIVHIIVVGFKMLVFYLRNKQKFKRTIGGDLSG